MIVISWFAIKNEYMIGWIFVATEDSRNASSDGAELVRHGCVASSAGIVSLP